MNLPEIDHDATIRVNVIRAFAAGLIWGTIFVLAFLSMGLLMWFSDPKSEWLTVILTGLQVGIGVFFFPLAYMATVLIFDFLLAPVGKFAKRLGILGTILGLFVPTDAYGLAFILMLVMIAGDPLVYLIWRISPSTIPVKEYKLMMFSGFIRVKNL